MILGARHFNHNYLVHNNKIMYKDKNGISSEINYGFKTLFAYMYEYYEGKRISETSMEDALELSLTVGEYSYALLPKYFRSVLGVTETLKFKRRQLEEEYNIKKFYTIPSVYGPVGERRTVERYVSDEENYFKKIAEDIEEKHKAGRPVVVFFRTGAEMDEFFKSEEY